MSEQITIDGLEFARHGKRLEGQVAVSDMPRLQSLLFSRQGMLAYGVSGFVSDMGKPRLRLLVCGLLMLECQRCLSELEFPLQISATLELVKNEESFVPVEEEGESVDLVPADSEMDVMAMVEDEVLLNLPVAPVHSSGTCHAASFRGSSELGEANPFEVLAAFKKNV